MTTGNFLAAQGDRVAVVMAETGDAITYAELDDRSMRLAQLFHARGLRPDDHVAILMENHPRYFEVFWAATRSGLHITPINWHLKAAEAGYIVEDCGARAIITSAALAPLARELAGHLGNCDVRLIVDGADGDLDGFERYEFAVAAHPAESLPGEQEGSIMFYSSGTTGRPKGIARRLTGEAFGASSQPLVNLIQMLFGFTDQTVYLCPAPLYHAAPLGWSTAAQRIGATIVVMERFDPARTLAHIAAHRVTHAQFVPTHFVRMLKLTDAERAAADVSSLQMAVHAAAPCPAPVKQAMLDWWGPVIHEYYAGSEGNGFCYASPTDWLAHPGTVGRSLLGPVHICDEDGNEAATGVAGQIWFESATVFEYHNDPAKTAAAFNDRGWSSLGDVGYLDAEGFLYLTDRISHMIISGGVNIYPQEVENELTIHPAVADVAVIGVPNEDLGEEVKAVVVPTASATAGAELATELMTYCRSRLAHYKCPVSIDFVTELPRLPTGKLLKRELRDRYRADAATAAAAAAAAPAVGTSGEG